MQLKSYKLFELKNIIYIPTKYIKKYLDLKYLKAYTKGEITKSLTRKLTKYLT